MQCPLLTFKIKFVIQLKQNVSDMHLTQGLTHN